jgi:hypothetical protein
MSFLEELNSLITGLGLPVETGVFSKKAPDEYMVITPLADSFGFHADNRPQCETQEARLSLYTKGNYLRRRNELVRALLAADFTVTARQYIGYEADTGFHHYAIDVAQHYELQEV